MTAQAAAVGFALAFAGCAASTANGPSTGVDGLAQKVVPNRPDIQPLGQFDMTELALLVSGYEARPALRSARHKFVRQFTPTLIGLSQIEDGETRARALLAKLHGASLQKYDARATTLRDVMETGRFNCLSSAVLYAVLAEKVDLRIRAQLLPSHVRVLVRLDRPTGPTWVPIETTSPLGFDPAPAALTQILTQVVGPADGGRALVAEGGETITAHMLIGAMYVNRASIAQEAGALAQAEKLFGRGEAFAETDAMRDTLREQRASLLSQLAADDIMSGDIDRLERAFNTMLSAVALRPQEPQIRRAVHQNLRAATERRVVRALLAEDLTSAQNLVAVAVDALDPVNAAGLRAFALSELARSRAESGDSEGAVAALDSALGEQLGADDRALSGTLRQNQVAALRLAAMTSAERGDYAKSVQIIERLQSIPGLSGEQRALYDTDRKRAVGIAAQKKLADGDLRGAADLYRRGQRLHPEDPTLRHNLVAVLQRLALPAVEAGRCAHAQNALDELASLGETKFAAELGARCLVLRAQEQLDQGDFAEAVRLLGEAQTLHPTRAHRGNYEAAVRAWTASSARSGDCETARSAAGRIAKSAKLRAALGRCR